MPPSPQPPVFQTSAFAQAMELATAKDLWLIVSVTALSDAACETMDDTSWRSPEVRAWIEQRALAVRINVAADREVARTLNVRAAPTSIAFKAGKQEDRIVGFRDATELFGWLGSLEERSTKPDGGLRHSSAKISLDDQRYDDATKRYVWLWNNIPGFDDAYDTGWMGVRQSGIANELESLVGAYPPAGAAFGAIRDASGAAAPAFDQGDWFGPRVDWLLLNRVLGEQERTLDWFNGVKAEPRYTRVIEHVAKLLLEPLKARQRWADIGRLFPDPLANFAEAYKEVTFGGPRPGVHENETSAALTRLLEIKFREEAVVLYAGLRAAGRTSDAKALRAEALRLDPSDEMRLALDQVSVPSN